MATISVSLHITINSSLPLQPVHKMQQQDIFWSPVMESRRQEMGPSTLSKDWEQKRQPWQGDRGTKRKCDIEPSCGCPCANSEAMVHLPDFNQERLRTKQCRCKQCGQVNESGRRRCSVRILLPFYIIRPTCNECNNGCSILERQQQKANRDYSREERRALQ